MYGVPAAVEAGDTEGVKSIACELSRSLSGDSQSLSPPRLDISSLQHKEIANAVGFRRFKGFTASKSP